MCYNNKLIQTVPTVSTDDNYNPMYHSDVYLELRDKNLIQWYNFDKNKALSYITKLIVISEGPLQ